MKRMVVGYGSLMSHQSLRETIPDKHFTPVIVKGYKRVFNLAIMGGKDPDVLNLEKSPNEEFNGVMFEVNDKELREFKKREEAYNLEETWAYDFLTGKKLCNCLIDIDYIVAIDKRHRKPNKDYFILCRESAYHISREFGKYWDSTTYTSDGERISSWLKKNKEYDTVA